LPSNSSHRAVRPLLSYLDTATRFVYYMPHPTPSGATDAPLSRAPILAAHTMDGHGSTLAVETFCGPLPSPSYRPTPPLISVADRLYILSAPSRVSVIPRGISHYLVLSRLLPCLTHDPTPLTELQALGHLYEALQLQSSQFQHSILTLPCYPSTHFYNSYIQQWWFTNSTEPTVPGLCPRLFLPWL